MDRKISLKYGLIAGGSVVLYFLLFYFLNKESMLKMWVAACSMLIYAFFMVSAVRDQRSLQENMITLREAISVAFLTFVVANAIYYVFYYFILKTNPELVESLKEMSIAFYQKILNNQDPAEIAKSFEGFEINFSTIMLSFARGAIGGFFLSVLIAGVMRRGKRMV